MQCTSTPKATAECNLRAHALLSILNGHCNNDVCPNDVQICPVHRRGKK